MEIKKSIKTTIILLCCLGIGTALLRFPEVSAVVFTILSVGLIWKIIYLILDDKKENS